MIKPSSLIRSEVAAVTKPVGSSSGFKRPERFDDKFPFSWSPFVLDSEGYLMTNCLCGNTEYVKEEATPATNGKFARAPKAACYTCGFSITKPMMAYKFMSARSQSRIVFEYCLFTNRPMTNIVSRDDCNIQIRCNDWQCKCAHSIANSNVDGKRYRPFPKVVGQHMNKLMIKDKSLVDVLNRVVDGDFESMSQLEEFVKEVTELKPVEGFRLPLADDIANEDCFINAKKRKAGLELMLVEMDSSNVAADQEVDDAVERAIEAVAAAPIQCAKKKAKKQ